MNMKEKFTQILLSGLETVDKYEDETLQEQAIVLIPLDEIADRVSQRMATVEGLDEQEVQILELLKWFKESFFKWVDNLSCQYCGNKNTQAVRQLARPTAEEAADGAARVELYRCHLCHNPDSRFPRYNNPGKLLQTKCGRCGEWANCFALVLRSIGYEVRWVRDWTDHVWVEVFSEKHGEFVHCDPCEAAWNKPLLYSKGWNKKLSYVVAFGRHGICDVTRNYVTGPDWHSTLKRRNIVGEAWLKAQISKITIQKQALMMADRERWVDYYAREAAWLEARAANHGEDSAGAGDLPGRESGSEAWRLSRGEMQKKISYKVRDFEVLCSGENSGSNENVYCLFDNQKETKWLDFSFKEKGHSFVEIVYKESRVLSAYCLVSANDERPRDPESWTLTGCDAEGKTIVLHKVSGAAFESRYQRKEFLIEDKRIPCKRFRFQFDGIFEKSAANSLQLCMLNLTFL